jgi:hypothetical protein
LVGWRGAVEALSPYYLGKWLGLDSSQFFGAHSSSYVGQLYSNIYIGVQQAIELDNSEKKHSITRRLYVPMGKEL